VSTDTAGHLLELAERLEAIEVDAAGCGVDVHASVHDAVMALGHEAGVRAVRELTWIED
jgi:hypothetical protein